MEEFEEEEGKFSVAPRDAERIICWALHRAEVKTKNKILKKFARIILDD
jgi:hypothetical protein